MVRVVSKNKVRVRELFGLLDMLIGSVHITVAQPEIIPHPKNMKYKNKPNKNNNDT